MSNIKDEIILRIKEALVKDVGRAIARIDPKDMKLLGLESGDIIMIEGKRSTPVKILPCYPEDREKQIIQIDGISRENAQSGIDEKVRVTKTTYRQAVKIKLKPETKSGSLFKSNDAKYIGSLINGLPVKTGDKVRANLFGSRSVNYTVTDTNPAGVVLIQPNTSFQLETTKVDGESETHSGDDRAPAKIPRNFRTPGGTTTQRSFSLWPSRNRKNTYRESCGARNRCLLYQYLRP